MSDTAKLNHCPKCGIPIPAEAPQGLCPKCVLLGAATATDAGVPATATSEIPSLERVAVAFPQLEVLELIGRGGMGFVFKARQPHLDRFVALKLLPDKLARDPHFTERFNREGRVLARLNHPNIVSVYDFGKTEHFYFLVMEFVDGVNLRQAMQAGRFSPGEALAIVPKICEALQYAHGQGILHRDIKPENLLLDARGHVKIADFGIAKLVGDEKPDVTLTATGAALGTLHYMAPEQLEKPSEVDHRADIYSLGVVFYEMLTGELPIGRFAAPSSKTPVGVNVDEVVFRTLEKDRERRYQSAGEMKTQVEHLGDAGAETFKTAHPNAPGAEAECGPGGNIVTKPENVLSDVPKWSQKAVWAAVLTGLSLPFPLLLSVVAYLGAGGLAWLEVTLALGAISLPGLASTILGWMALSDIRAHQGRLRGLPLAVFAALAWPLFFLVGGTLVIPWLMLSRSASLGAGLAGGAVLALLVPVGTITFAIWAVYAAVRWGANKPTTQRRGVLKWVFVCLLLGGMGVVLVLNSNSRASAERWSPPLTPDEKPNLEKIRQEAGDLARQGRYEEALQRHLWYHRHALEFDPALAGVRLSFALSEWAEMARRYPKAKEALVEIRDRGTRELASGGGHFDLFQEVSSINEELGQDEATYVLFRSIQSRDPKLADQCYWSAEDLLVEKGEYALCASFIPDFQQRFEEIRAMRELHLADRTPAGNQTLIRQHAQRTFLNDTRKLIEILVGVGRKAEAEQIRDQAVAVLNVPELQSAVADAEKKVERAATPK